MAYAGPATVTLRKDLASKSPSVGTASHAEKLDVLETRRRFVRVRTGKGIVGWTDSNLLLTAQQMEDLRRLADLASKSPSQGAATVYEVINVHSEPSRQAPSFYQIPEGGSVEVIGHRPAPRTAAPAALAAPVRRVAAAKKTMAPKQPKKSGPAPPAPAAPPPPSEWTELSRPRASDLGVDPSSVQPTPAPVDDWDLVRTHDGRVGWVLARMLNMSIPDDVAQYAEGHHITAYVSLGDVKDKDDIKHNWLWTTASPGLHDFEFDSFRVFVWSTRRHHYETAYIERNVKGYYPVQAETIPDEEDKGFSLVLEDKDGQLYKRTYAFSGYHVRMKSKTSYTPAIALPEIRATRSFDPVQPAPAVSKGVMQSLRDWRKKWIGR